MSWGHPHSTYAQRGRGELKPSAYDCVQWGWGFKVVHVRKKIFLSHKISIYFFFYTKEAITLPFIIVQKKCKPGFSDK